MRVLCACETISKPYSGEFDRTCLPGEPAMPPQHRSSIPRPALWIAVPTFVVALAAAASMQAAGVTAAIVIALLGSVAVGCFAEGRLPRIIASVGKISRGHRAT